MTQIIAGTRIIVRSPAITACNGNAVLSRNATKLNLTASGNIIADFLRQARRPERLYEKANNSIENK